MHAYKRRFCMFVGFCILLIFFCTTHVFADPFGYESMQTNLNAGTSIFQRNSFGQIYDAHSRMFYSHEVLFLSQGKDLALGVVSRARSYAAAFLLFGLLMLISHKLWICLQSFLLTKFISYPNMNVIASSLGGHAPPLMPNMQVFSTTLE